MEEIRDGLLALDGSLTLPWAAPLQKGLGTDKEYSDDRKPQSRKASGGRCISVAPLQPSDVLNLFDFGDATTPGEGRSQTNVAPQALFMMNSDFVAEQAQYWPAIAGE